MGWGPRVNSKEERKLGDNIHLSAFEQPLPLLPPGPPCRDGLCPRTASQTFCPPVTSPGYLLTATGKVNIREKNFIIREETELRHNRILLYKRAHRHFLRSCLKSSGEPHASGRTSPSSSLWSISSAVSQVDLALQRKRLQSHEHTSGFQ